MRKTEIDTLHRTNAPNAHVVQAQKKRFKYRIKSKLQNCSLSVGFSPPFGLLYKMEQLRSKTMENVNENREVLHSESNFRQMQFYVRFIKCVEFSV